MSRALGDLGLADVKQGAIIGYQKCCGLGAEPPMIFLDALGNDHLDSLVHSEPMYFTCVVFFDLTTLWPGFRTPSETCECSCCPRSQENLPSRVAGALGPASTPFSNHMVVHSPLSTGGDFAPQPLQPLLHVPLCVFCLVLSRLVLYCAALFCCVCCVYCVIHI